MVNVMWRTKRQRVMPSERIALPMKQRDKMRELRARFHDKRGLIVAAYVSAEARGEVTRAKNIRRTSPEIYADKLLSDGIRKGWINTR